MVANLSEQIALSAATSYLRSIARFVDIPVLLNGTMLSQEGSPWTEPERLHNANAHRTSFAGKSGEVSLICLVSADQSGRPTITFDEIKLDGKPILCNGTLSARGGAVSTYRYGFKLADVGVSSSYNLSGHVDCPILKPTAGRDTLDSSSKDILGKCIGIADLAVTHLLSSKPGLADSNASFFRYIRNHNMFDLLEHATVRVYGTETRIALGDIQSQRESTEIYFSQGSNPAIMEAFSKQGKVVVVLSTDTQAPTNSAHYE